MFSTSHLPPASPSSSLSVFFSQTNTIHLSICLSLLCFLFFYLLLLSFFFLLQSFYFSVFFSLNPLFLFSFCDIFFVVTFGIQPSRSCVQTRMSTHTHTDRQCVVESEKVSVLFSGQLGLIFSTFCFHTLTDSPQAETERETHTHTNTHVRGGKKETSQSERCIQRFHNDDRRVHTHSHAQTGTGRHTSQSEMLFSQS